MVTKEDTLAFAEETIPEGSFLLLCGSGVQNVTALKDGSTGNLSVDSVPHSGDAFRGVEASHSISLLNNSAILCIWTGFFS